jgi:transposase
VLSREWLSDAEWARIEPLLPRGRRGTRRVDDWRVISGIVHMLQHAHQGAPLGGRR